MLLITWYENMRLLTMIIAIVCNRQMFKINGDNIKLKSLLKFLWHFAGYLILFGQTIALNSHFISGRMWVSQNFRSFNSTYQCILSSILAVSRSIVSLFFFPRKIVLHFYYHFCFSTFVSIVCFSCNCLVFFLSLSI